MIYTKETLKEIKTPSDVKCALSNDSHFFERKTMKFFGDKMTSFGVRTVNGKRVLYRKPSAMVNVFGTWKVCGRTYFRAWEIMPKYDHVELSLLTDNDEEIVYNSL